MESDAMLYKKCSEVGIDDKVLSELTLDESDTVSILFLLNGTKKNALKEVLNALALSKTRKNFWATYLINFPNWKHLFYECLILIQNIEILKFKFKCSNRDINQFINYKLFPTKYINHVLQNLYLLCDSLTLQQMKQVLDEVYSENVEKVHFEYLELHILHWMQIQYITIFENDNHSKGNFNNLLKILKKMQYHDSIPYKNLEKLNVIPEVNTEMLNGKLNNNLCIIINEENYVSLGNREGSQTDVKNLNTTFKGCGFQTVNHENLDLDVFIEVLKEIPVKYKNKYRAIVLFILSHGNKGEIITTDDRIIKFRDIRKYLCCVELSDVFKIVIAQCCQGPYYGIKSGDNLIETDGVQNFSCNRETLSKNQNFILWRSTLKNFKSFRHQEAGSWFVQELCKILQTEKSDRSLHNCYILLNQRLKMRKDFRDGEDFGQLSEISSSGMIDTFTFPPFTKDIPEDYNNYTKG